MANGIKGTEDVSAGTWELNLEPVENPSGKCGERGTIKFTPNARAQDTDSLRILQIVKDLNLDTGSDYEWTGDEARRMDAMTEDNHATALGVAGGAVGGAAMGAGMGGMIGGPVGAGIGAAIGAAAGALTGGVIGAQNQVEGGYFVDRLHANMSPRENPDDPAVSPYYIDDYGEGSSGGANQDGYKKGADDIKAASIWDFPGSSGNRTFSFETAAKGADNDLIYGTVKWQFTIRDKKLSDESFEVHDSQSATFDAALDKFNEVYQNPGASTAP